jgi:hypothetical protein
MQMTTELEFSLISRCWMCAYAWHDGKQPDDLAKLKKILPCPRRRLTGRAHEPAGCARDVASKGDQTRFTSHARLNASRAHLCMGAQSATLQINWCKRGHKANCLTRLTKELSNLTDVHKAGKRGRDKQLWYPVRQQQHNVSRL